MRTLMYFILFMIISITWLFFYILYFLPDDKLHIVLSGCAFFVYLGFFVYSDIKSRKKQ